MEAWKENPHLTQRRLLRTGEESVEGPACAKWRGRRPFPWRWKGGVGRWSTVAEELMAASLVAVATREWELRTQNWGLQRGKENRGKILLEWNRGKCAPCLPPLGAWGPLDYYLKIKKIGPLHWSVAFIIAIVVVVTEIVGLNIRVLNYFWQF